MSEIQYKFKSSLNFEKIPLLESFITVGELKERINKKQSIKTNGFDLKFKDSEGRVYSGDNEIIDAKFKIIVSRCPKVVKPPVNSVRKKDFCPINKNNGDTQTTADQINNQVDEIKDTNECSAGIECSEIQTLNNTIIIPKIPDCLKCSLCKNIMKDAMMINCCKKNYCYECITGYLFDPDISGSMECPDCKFTVSNDGSTLIENLKFRELILKFLNGTLDVSTCDKLVHEDEIIEQDHTNDVKSSYNISDDKEDISCLNTEDNHQGDILIDDISNMYEDNLMNQINMDCDMLQFKDTYECQNDPHSTEEATFDILNENKIIPNNEEKQPEEITEKKDIKEHLKGHNLAKSSSQKKEISKSDQICKDTKKNANVKNSVNKSIKDLEFDPVLYMKFLKIVGESYPEELKQILSNNNIEKTNKRKDSARSSSSNTKQKFRDEDYYESKPPAQKKYRKEVVTEIDDRFKKVYDNNNGNRKREVHLDNRGYYEEGHRRGGISLNPQNIEQFARNNGNEISEIKSNRLREMEPPRSKDYYQHNSSRYVRSQFDSQPTQFYDDRRRFKNDQCSTSYQSDKQKYNRRSDR